MKILFLGALLICSFKLSGQVSESFNDGDFTHNPTWTGDSVHFEVSALRLHLKAPATTSISYLSTTSNVSTEAKWEFYVQFDFNPSSANFAKYYLMADNANLKNPQHGYFVRIGYTEDDVCLFRQDGTTETKLINGKDSRLNTSSVKVRIKVTRNSQNVWELFTDTLGLTNYYSEGSCIDTTYLQSAFTGILCTYSSTRSTLFWLDDIDIAGKIFKDTIAPKIKNYQPTKNNNIRITFSETIDTNSITNNNNYQLNGITCITQVILINSTTIELTFSETFRAGENKINLTGIRDLEGNTSMPMEIILQFYQPQKFDVVFNEIMADPSPPVELPEWEYIELYNRSNYAINLYKWKLVIGKTVKTFPNYTLPAHDYLIMCHTSAVPIFSSYGNTIGLLTSSSSLNNDGQSLQLCDSTGKTISFVQYSSSWYGNNNKNSGGWSLEQIDVNNPCSGSNNWTASTSNVGGTPGKKNASAGLNPDLEAPFMKQISVLSDSSLLIIFNEAVDSTEATAKIYKVDNSIGYPASITISGPDYTNVTAVFSKHFVHNQLYQLNITGRVHDCSGNASALNQSIPFALPSVPAYNDIVINEILFNPQTNGVDFIEIYNRSSNVIDVKDLRIAGRDIYTATLTPVYEISTTGLLIFPGDYYVLTTNPDKVKEQYITTNPAGFISCKIPSMPDDKGTIVLTDKSFNSIDEFSYTNKMHIPLLTNTEGVSLERIHYNRKTQDSTNWHSAAETVGYATPAYQNSQFTEITDNDSPVSIDPELFSPDNDGFKDIITIHYKFNKPGNIAHITIFNDHGLQVKEIGRNIQLGTNGIFSWDGIEDTGNKAPIGIYILYFEVFNTDGSTHTYRKAFVLATLLL